MNAEKLAGIMDTYHSIEGKPLYKEIATELRQQQADLKDADKYALELERLYEDAKAEIEALKIKTKLQL